MKKRLGVVSIPFKPSLPVGRLSSMAMSGFSLMRFNPV